MKKMYINPKTDLMAIEAVNYIAAGSPEGNSVDVNNTSQSGMDGAPKRQGLKYLSAI